MHLTGKFRPVILNCIVILLVAAGFAPRHQGTLQRELSGLKDQNDVIAVANKLFICTGNRGWSCVKDVFAPKVLFDMTSLTGGQPERKMPRQIAEARRK